VSSTQSIPKPRKPPFDWREAGLRYYSYVSHLRAKYGCRVQRVSLDGGFTCPNVDGTVAAGGCVFCDNRSFSPSRRVPRKSITQQIDQGIARLQRRYECERFIAYFQPATNTYAPVARLRSLFTEAAAHPQIAELAIGTRPDCVPDNVLDLIAELAAEIPVTVEYGMQTMHDRSLDWMNRGHHHDATVDAIERSRGRGFEIGVHVMLGLPGESPADMLATAREVARLDVDSVKIHNLYVVRNTPLADDYARGEVQLLGRDEFIDVLIEFLEILPPTLVIERTIGDAPGDYLVAPSWCRDKPGFLKALDAELRRRDTWQGKKSCRRRSAG